MNKKEYVEIKFKINEMSSYDYKEMKELIEAEKTKLAWVARILLYEKLDNFDITCDNLKLIQFCFKHLDEESLTDDEKLLLIKNQGYYPFRFDDELLSKLTKEDILKYLKDKWHRMDIREERDANMFYNFRKIYEKYGNICDDINADKTRGMVELLWKLVQGYYLHRFNKEYSMIKYTKEDISVFEAIVKDIEDNEIKDMPSFYEMILDIMGRLNVENKKLEEKCNERLSILYTEYYNQLCLAC